ncbi:MAG: hypothetical protein OK474_04165 [Thaumarchaeota archaeon]|nr:hypothetical protein [Nitrososphaerota archaeon]
MISEATQYDAARYVELLEAACKTVLDPFAQERLWSASTDRKLVKILG